VSRTSASSSRKIPSHPLGKEFFFFLQDIALLLEKIPSGPVREAVQFAIEEKGKEGYHLKEIYLVVRPRLASSCGPKP